MIDSRKKKEYDSMGNKYILPKFKRSILYDHKLYFSSYNYNGFFSIDLKTGETVLEGYFFLEGIENTMLSGRMLRQENRIYFTPVLSKNIYYYDLNDKKMRVIGRRTMSNEKSEADTRKCSMILYSFGNIYLLSPSEDYMLKINKDDTYEEALNIKEKYWECFHVEYSYFSDAGYYEYNNRIYIPVEEQPVITEWKNEELKFHILPYLEKGFIASFGYENKMYLLTCNGEIVMVDIESMQILKIEKIKVQENDFSQYRAVHCNGGTGYFLSYTSNSCIKIQLEDCFAEMVTTEEEWGMEAFCGEIFCFSCIGGESKYFISNFNRLAVVNDCGFHIIALKYNVDELREHMTRRITERQNNEIITEYDMKFDLEVFLQSICQHKPAHLKTDYGVRIYNDMKKLIEN